jgi:amidase
LDGDGSAFQRRLDSDQRGKRVAWVRDFNGHTPCDPEVLAVCSRAVRVFESLGCRVEEAAPEFELDSVWQALIRLRGWQEGGGILKYYNDAANRRLLKPEAVYEVETGLRQSAFDISAASAVRTAWSNAVQRFFERYDYFVVPTAQLFPFDAELHWPREVGGVTMQTYHEWMKVALFVTLSGCPALAVPAGFSAQGLPIGIQIVAPNRRELDCLQLAYAYEAAMDPAWKRLPELIRT